MSRLGLVLLCAVLGTTAACASAIRQPTPADAELAQARYPGTTLEDLRQGRSLYVAKCAGCHQLYLPTSKKPEAWPAVVADMAPRSAMGPEKARLIERYLVAAAHAHSDDRHAPSR